MAKAFVCLLSCQKYSYKREQQNIDELAVDYRYFIGDPSLSEAKESGSIVYLPCPDSYEYLTHKTLQAFRWMEENIEAEFYFKTDDDTMFDKEQFLLLMQEIQNNKIQYGGELHPGGVMSVHHFGKCEDDRINKQRFYVPNIVYVKGGGYVLSRESLSLVNKTKNKKDYFCIYEDATIGNILNQHGINPKPLQIRKAFNWDVIK